MTPIRFTAITRARLFPNGGGEPDPLTLIVAPRGFGKTTLVSQWVNSPTFSGFDVRTIYSGRARHSEEQLWEIVADQLGAPPGFDSHLRVEQAVEALDRPTMVIFDDYQTITSPQIDTALLNLLKLSDNLYLTVNTRRSSILDGPIDLAQLPISLLTARDLAMTNEEIAELGELQGIDLQKIPSDILQQAQGWPFIIASSFREVTVDPSLLEGKAFCARFAREQIEASGIGGAAKVVGVVALCGSIRANLIADTLKTTEDVVVTALNALEEQGIVLRHWYPSGVRYRVHSSLPKTYTQAALNNLGRKGGRDLLIRHALDLAEDDPDTALVQLLRVGETARAEQVLISHFLIATNESSQFVQVIGRIPRLRLQAYPALLSALLMVGMANGDLSPKEIEQITGQIRKATKDLELSRPEAVITALGALVGAERLSGNIAEAFHWAQELDHYLFDIHSANLSPIRNSLSFLHSIVAITAIAAGDFTLAKRAYKQALQAAEEEYNESEQIRGLGGLALTFALTGELTNSRKCVESAENIARTTGARTPHTSRINLSVTRAILATEDLDLEGFRAAMAPVEEIMESAEHAPLLTLSEVDLTRSLQGERKH